MAVSSILVADNRFVILQVFHTNLLLNAQIGGHKTSTNNIFTSCMGKRAAKLPNRVFQNSRHTAASTSNSCMDRCTLRRLCQASCCASLEKKTQALRSSVIELFEAYLIFVQCCVFERKLSTVNYVQIKITSDL